ncbi:MAG: NUDIX domain-containing protein [Phycisphaerae bacterium]
MRIFFFEHMPISSGILLFRRRPTGIEVLLVHPGGPLFKKKDAGFWGIPKGLVHADEDLLIAACREFEEEVGFAPTGPFISLTPVKLKSGKIVHAWACEGDCDPATIKSNNFTMEWPPHSGRQMEFPEVDRAGWFTVEEARVKMNPGQMGLVEEMWRMEE